MGDDAKCPHGRDPARCVRCDPWCPRNVPEETLDQWQRWVDDGEASGVVYEATPEEIGELRREIRNAERESRGADMVPFSPFMKAATLSRRSWLHLVQRMRPAELRLLCEVTGRDQTGARARKPGTMP